MGYYSDVALTLRKEDALELIKQAKEDKTVWPFMCTAHMINQNEYVTLHWEWVKWYDDYEEIQFITAFYRNLDEYSFKRIGEDNSDIEEEWNGDDDNIAYKAEIDVKCSKIVYRLCNHMVYSFDILKASQKKRKRWRWLGRKGLWK